MNLRHAAALALAGTWLLVTPPKEPRPFGQFRVMTEAPLSQWSTIGTFPTEDDCEVASHPIPNSLMGFQVSLLVRRRALRLKVLSVSVRTIRGSSNENLRDACALQPSQYTRKATI
jgi:hypothetical protein